MVDAAGDPASGGGDASAAAEPAGRPTPGEGRGGGVPPAMPRDGSRRDPPHRRDRPRVVAADEDAGAWPPTRVRSGAEGERGVAAPRTRPHVGGGSTSDPRTRPRGAAAGDVPAREAARAAGGSGGRRPRAMPRDGRRGGRPPRDAARGEGGARGGRPLLARPRGGFGDVASASEAAAAEQGTGKRRGEAARRAARVLDADEAAGGGPRGVVARAVPRDGRTGHGGFRGRGRPDGRRLAHRGAGLGPAADVASVRDAPWGGVGGRGGVQRRL